VPEKRPALGLQVRLVERPVLGPAARAVDAAAPRAVAVAAARRAGRLRGLVLRPRQAVGHQVRVGPRSVRRVRQVRPDAVAAAAALRTTRVDDRLERGGLRSQWLRHAELTGGVRGRDARLDHQVEAGRHQQRALPALLHRSRQQHPCQQYQGLLQYGHDHRGLW